MNKKFIVAFRSYGDLDVVDTACVTHEAAISAIADDLEINAREFDDLDDENYYIVYEVSAEYKFVPPTDKGSLVAV